uniref:Putative secreted protein n=1 Tax=Rhipicephalus microplus TaxID=6941 RepID=A0A6G5A0L2_RHIMP
MVFGFPVIYIVNILFFINHFYAMQPHQAAAKSCNGKERVKPGRAFYLQTENEQNKINCIIVFKYVEIKRSCHRR